jgi:hypothetical protein
VLVVDVKGREDEYGDWAIITGSLHNSIALSFRILALTPSNNLNVATLYAFLRTLAQDATHDAITVEAYSRRQN